MPVLSTLRLILLAAISAVPLAAAEEYFDITVSPPSGDVTTTFKIVLTNRTLNAVPFLPCHEPSVTSVLDGALVNCPPPVQCDPLSFRPGQSWTWEWTPKDRCGSELVPGLYEVTQDQLKGVARGRVEIFPPDVRRLKLDADPPQTRLGEKVTLTVENSSAIPLRYDLCCHPPLALDPTGHAALCPICPRCTAPGDFLPGGKLTFDWTPGEAVCDAGLPSLPGIYRLVWNRFQSLPPGNESPEVYAGEVQVRVLPAPDRTLELTLSNDTLCQGDTLTVTATNRLGVTVFYFPCCDSVILIDEMGRTSPCDNCTLPCAFVYKEVPPDGSISTEVALPPLTARGCNLRPGRWSVIWGDHFRLTPTGDLEPPVFGYAEITVLPPDGEEPPFRRGDCDGSTDLDVTDAIHLLSFLFQGGSAPTCPDACDGDDSGGLDVTDAVYLLNYLFLGGPAPLPPFAAPGPDPTPDGLGACR